MGYGFSVYSLGASHHNDEPDNYNLRSQHVTGTGKVRQKGVEGRLVG